MHPAVPPLSHPSGNVREASEVTIYRWVVFVTAPDNQQERLDDYLAGYVDGEGSFHVAIHWSSRILRGHTPNTGMSP